MYEVVLLFCNSNIEAAILDPVRLCILLDAPLNVSMLLLMLLFMDTRHLCLFLCHLLEFVILIKEEHKKRKNSNALCSSLVHSVDGIL